MDTFYAECEYCGPLPVYGDASPETTDRGHIDDTVDEHTERFPNHIVKTWQLVGQQGTGRIEHIAAAELDVDELLTRLSTALSDSPDLLEKFSAWRDTPRPERFVENPRLRAD